MIAITEEVSTALNENAPVVALESTILSHGLPESIRVDAAHRFEKAVRDQGAVPATIAVVDRQLRVGFDAPTLERVSTNARKASLRDLPVALAEGGAWSTTVAATMAIAARTKIRVFATGGIGGVHRGAERTFDESADLIALSRYPVAVVCAGPKAVLDLPRTMERLETWGVPVVGFGTKELPAFYHPRGKVPLACSVEEVETAARILFARFEQLKDGGVLVVQPPPAASWQDPGTVDALIEDALARAEAQSIRGAKVTPFLLRTLDEASGGSVVETNLALMEQNASLAGRLAVAYSAINAD